MLNRTCAFVSFLAVTLAVTAYADDFIIVGKDTKVFDEPNAKGYVTLNTKNEEVVLMPGMAFKTLECSQGWHVIEYSPGLRGYMSEQATAAATKYPVSGSYTVKNAPAKKLNATCTSGIWTAKVGDMQYRGESYGNVVIFVDGEGHPSYSITDLGAGPIVYTYDNSVTKYF